MLPVAESCVAIVKRAQRLVYSGDGTPCLYHGYYDLHHVLLVVLETGDSVAANAFLDRGIDADVFRAALLKVHPVGEIYVQMGGPVGRTLAMRDASDRAIVEARDFACQIVDEDHLVLGIIYVLWHRPGETSRETRAIFARLGLNPREVYLDMRQRLGDHPLPA